MLSSPYQRTEVSLEEKEIAAKSARKTTGSKLKIPRIEAKDLEQLSKSWYPVQQPTRHIANDKEPLFVNKAIDAQTVAGAKSSKADISEDWEMIEHEDANDHVEEVSTSGKLTRSVASGIQ